MPKMTNAQEFRRAAIEIAMQRLDRRADEAEMDLLRVKQAIRRHPDLQDLLAPVACSLCHERYQVKRLHSLLSAEWEDAQAAGWSHSWSDGSDSEPGMTGYDRYFHQTLSEPACNSRCPLKKP